MVVDWAKVKFFYKTMIGSEGSTLTATSTESIGDFDPDYLGNWLEKNKWKAEDSGLADPQYITYDAGANLGSELLSNIGFETAGGGGADVFASWTETASDGAIADETTLFNSGAHACKLTQGASLATSIDQTAATTADDVMELSFYTRGDGTYDGRYRIYDVTNAAWITAITSTGVTGTTYAQIIKHFTVPTGCTQVQVFFYPAGTDTAIAYFDDTSLKVDTATAEADYLAILGHNLYTAGVTVTLQYSIDNFDADTNDAFTGVAVTADTVFLEEFTSPGAYRYWRLKIAGHGATAPYMTLCVWGETTELDYMTSPIDPHDEDEEATINLTYGGYVSGGHLKHIERKLSLSFDSAEVALYDKAKAWKDDHGIQNFFVAWEIDNNPGDVWLMRYVLKTFKAPWDGENSSYRNISFQLKGRKE